MFNVNKKLTRVILVNKFHKNVTISYFFANYIIIGLTYTVSLSCCLPKYYNKRGFYFTIKVKV